MAFCGDFDTGLRVELGDFTTVDATGLPTALTAGSLVVYRDASTTKATSGMLLSASFNSVTGLNHVSIFCGSDTTFYSVGHDYRAVLFAGSVGTINVAGYALDSFSIRNRAGLYPTVAGRTLAIAAAGQAGIDWANLASPTTAVSLSATSIGLLAGQDILRPTAFGRTLDVSAGGEAGIDWANIGQPTTAQSLTGTSLGLLSNTRVANVTLVDTLTTYTGNTPQTGDVFPLASTEIADIKAKTDLIPAAPASTTNITAGTITTVTNLTNAPTVGDLTAAMKTSVTTAATAATPVAASVTGAVGSVTGNVGGNVTGSVGSVVGAVGSVTGNVGGNVTGSVGSVVGAVGSVTGLTASNVGAIKAKTDQFNFSIAGAVDSDVIYWDGAVAGSIGDGQPVVHVADFLSTAATDIGALPTNAELATALTGERTAIADAWTARNIAGGSSAGRTNGQAMATLRNKVTIVAGVLTVYDTDDTTILFSGPVTTAAGDPLASFDPT